MFAEFQLLVVHWAFCAIALIVLFSSSSWSCFFPDLTVSSFRGGHALSKTNTGSIILWKSLMIRLEYSSVTNHRRLSSHSSSLDTFLCCSTFATYSCKITPFFVLKTVLSSISAIRPLSFSVICATISFTEAFCLRTIVHFFICTIHNG